MDLTAIAESMASTASGLPGETAIRIDVSTFSAEQVRHLIDAILTQVSRKKSQLRGVRTDYRNFAKLGIPQDTVNSGIYNNIPVVMTPSADFDTMEFVFQTAP